MKAFIVELENRPGEMARVTEKLAAREVNILVCAFTMGNRGGLAFVANNEDRARSALMEAKIGCREVEVVHVKMEDKPGQAASASRKLAHAGVNIELFLPVDTRPTSFTVAIGVNNVEAATKALGNQITTWSYR